MHAFRRYPLYLRVILLAWAFLLAHAAAALAQTPVVVIPPGNTITATWDAQTSTPGNAPTGYRFEVFRETATGVVVTTVDVPATATPRATLPATILPESDEVFLLAMRAFNVAGVSGRSNAAPFVRASLPAVPTNLQLTVP